MFTLALSYLPWILTVLFGALALWLYLRGYNPEAPENTDLDEDFQDLEAQIYQANQGIADLEKRLEMQDTKISKLELECSELYEFVNRNLKKMSTRAQRAEELTQLLEESKEIDSRQSDMFNEHVPSSGRRGRLIRR